MTVFYSFPSEDSYQDISALVNQVIAKQGHKIMPQKFLYSESDGDALRIMINSSDLVVVDVSNSHSNVIFQLGYACSLGKPILVLIRRMTSISMDIKPFRIIAYDRATLNETLVVPLEYSLTLPNVTDYFSSYKSQLHTDKEMKKTVFVSYSHVDVSYLNRLKVHLKPFEKKGQIDLWEDTQIKAGEKWKEEIEKALERAAIAILLISADFLASDFIVDNELPPLLEAAKKGGKVILPVIIRPCNLDKESEILRIQAVNNPKEPVSSFDENGREEIYVKIAERIADAIR